MYRAGLLFLVVCIVYVWLKTRRILNSSRFPTTVCFLTITPSASLIQFARRLVKRGHPVYILCDGPPSLEQPTGIAFLQVDDAECRAAGYVNANPVFPKTPTAWDKALYYFSKVKPSPYPVWFIEDDVFIPRADMLAEIDHDHWATDLLVGEDRSQRACPAWSWWGTIGTKLERPFYSGMVCAVRLSQPLLNEIAAYVERKKSLCFIEYMFHTLAHSADLLVGADERLITVTYREEWDETTVDANHVFHPIKDHVLQDRLREKIDKGFVFPPTRYRGSLYSGHCLYSVL